jgi:hypothetical protein
MISTQTTRYPNSTVNIMATILKSYVLGSLFSFRSNSTWNPKAIADLIYTREMLLIMPLKIMSLIVFIKIFLAFSLNLRTKTITRTVEISNRKAKKHNIIKKLSWSKIEPLLSEAVSP